MLPLRTRPLTEHEQIAFDMRNNCQTYSAIAKKIGKTKERARQLYAQACNKKHVPYKTGKEVSAIRKEISHVQRKSESGHCTSKICA
jgi:DNA-directed RNA polymerase sigma subunit (sigma70/sigma32)